MTPRVPRIFTHTLTHFIVHSLFSTPSVEDPHLLSWVVTAHPATKPASAARLAVVSDGLSLHHAPGPTDICYLLNYCFIININ